MIAANALAVTMSEALLAAIFSLGGAAAITAFFKGIQLWRTGTAATEARTIMNVEKSRDAAVTRAEREATRADAMQEHLDYWRRRAGNLEFIIGRLNGEDKIPALPPPPRDVEAREVQVKSDG